MPKAFTNAIAEQAAEAFNRTVDGLVIEKLTGLPNLGAKGVSAASEQAINNLPTTPGAGLTR